MSNIRQYRVLQDYTADDELGGPQSAGALVQLSVQQAVAIEQIQPGTLELTAALLYDNPITGEILASEPAAPKKK